MNSVKQNIRQHIADKLGVDENMVQDESSFADDLGADSLDVFELFTGIEKEFGITIADEDAEKIKTVNALNIYVLKHVSIAAEE